MTDTDIVLTLAKAQWAQRRAYFEIPGTPPSVGWETLGVADRAQITEWASQVFALAKPLILAQAASASQPKPWPTITSAPVGRVFLARAEGWRAPAVMQRKTGTDRVFYNCWANRLVSDDSAPTHWTEIPE